MPSKPFHDGGTLALQPFTENDLIDVVALEKAASDYPWSEKNFIDSLQSKHLCMGATVGDEWAGVLVVQNKVVDAEVLILAVHPKFQRKGVARALMEEVIASCLPKAERLFLEVRESNQGAIALYDELGFNCMGERRNYYPCKGGREDALIYALELQLEHF